MQMAASPDDAVLLICGFPQLPRVRNRVNPSSGQLTMQPPT